MLLAIACALVAAFLLLAATHVHGFMGWMVVVPLVLACPPRCSRRRAVAIGSLFGITVALAGDARWVATAGESYFGLPPWGATLAAGGLGMVFGGSFGCLLGLGMRGALALPGAWPIVAFPAVWVMWEALILGVIPYYPWVCLAATQVQHVSLLQIASAVGQGGVSFAMVASGTALGLAMRARGNGPAWVRLGVAGFAIPAVVAGVGALRLAMRSEAGGRGCALAAVDAQVSASDRSRDGILQRYLMGTAEAVKQGATRVVWPESALPGYPETDAALQRQLRELVSDAGATTLIAGGPRVEWTAGWEQRLFNSVYQVETTGPLRSYDKRRLVPFAEYWPGGLPARPAWLATDEVAPGTRAGVFTAGGCRYGVVICFEAEDPALARELARAGADVLLVLSNDAQVPPPAVWKEIGQVQLRAVETGVPVVRAANSGISVAVDRYGVVRRQQEGGVLLAPALRAQPTAAVRFAPGFNLVCWLAAAAVLAGGVVRR